jgi:hypothetical protein
MHKNPYSPPASDLDLSVGGAQQLSKRWIIYWILFAALSILSEHASLTSPTVKLYNYLNALLTGFVIIGFWAQIYWLRFLPIIKR